MYEIDLGKMAPCHQHMPLDDLQDREVGLFFFRPYKLVGFQQHI